MPLYEFECRGERRFFDHVPHKEEHWLAISEREQKIPCSVCGRALVRLPGGHGMLHFEEGRGRTHISLSDKPITSYAEQKRLMRVNGVVEGGNNVPPSVARNPKSVGMKRFLEKDKGGRWL